MLELFQAAQPKPTEIVATCGHGNAHNWIAFRVEFPLCRCVATWVRVCDVCFLDADGDPTQMRLPYHDYWKSKKPVIEKAN